MYRLFSQFSCLATLEAAHLELSRQNRHVPPQTTDKTSSPCQLQVKLIGTPFWIFRIDWSYCEAKQDLRVDLAQIVPACCVSGASPYFCVNTRFGTFDGTTIVMTAHNNRDIIIVPYEDLPDEHKDVIGKAIEEF